MNRETDDASKRKYSSRMRGAIGLLVLSAAIGPPARAAAPLRATFIGNSVFEITDGRTVLFLDFPYRSGAFGYMTYSESLVRPAKNAVCLFTHAHADHFAPELVARVGCTVLGPATVRSAFPGAIVLAAGKPFEIPPITVLPIRTEHGPDHFSYRVTWGNRRLYFTGDTEEPREAAAERRLDALFITPWLLEAGRRDGMAFDARTIVVTHRRSGEKVDCRGCVVPRQGETLTLSR